MRTARRVPLASFAGTGLTSAVLRSGEYDKVGVTARECQPRDCQPRECHTELHAV
jgi:hypothetical protein